MANSSCVDILFYRSVLLLTNFNFMYFSSLSSSCVCFNVCCNPAFLAAKSKKVILMQKK